MIKLVDVFVMGPFAWRLGHSSVVDAQCPTFSTPFTPRDWKMDTSPTAPFRICDEDFPRSNRWSNTIKYPGSGHKLLRKLPTPDTWNMQKKLGAGHEGMAVSKQLWNAAVLKFGQVSTGHGGSKLISACSYTCIRLLGQTAATMAITKKGFEAVLLSLTYSYSVRKVNKSNGLTGCSNI